MTQRRFPTLMLLEASQDYDAMFKDILSNERCSDFIRAEIKDGIAWARKVLKKQDRVIWWLRYLKAIALAQSIEGSDKDRQVTAQNFIRRTDDTSSVTAAQTIISGTGKDMFEHWFSLDYVKIQNYVMGNKSYLTVRAELRELEREYVDRANAKIKHDDPSLQGTETLIDCGGGWYWVNLHRAACEVEGKAMGHCGNSPRSTTDDVVLSLRKYKEKSDGTSYWEPHLTFTIEDNGELMEMKGRGNKKPAPQYHEMIVKLLLYQPNGDWFVNDIVGGTWLPENDFSIEDLSPELKNKVLMARPELGNIFDYVEYGGNVLGRDMGDKLRQYFKRVPIIKYRSPDWWEWSATGGRLVYNCPLGSIVRPFATGKFDNRDMNWSALQSDPIMACFGLFGSDADIARYRKNASEKMISEFQLKWKTYVSDEMLRLLENELGDAAAFTKIEWYEEKGVKTPERFHKLSRDKRSVTMVITDPKAFVIALKDRMVPPMILFIKVANYIAGTHKSQKLIDLNYQVDTAFARLVNKSGDYNPPA